MSVFRDRIPYSSSHRAMHVGLSLVLAVLPTRRARVLRPLDPDIWDGTPPEIYNSAWDHHRGNQLAPAHDDDDDDYIDDPNEDAGESDQASHTPAAKVGSPRLSGWNTFRSTGSG